MGVDTWREICSTGLNFMLKTGSLCVGVTIH